MYGTWWKSPQSRPETWSLPIMDQHPRCAKLKLDGHDWNRAMHRLFPLECRRKEKSRSFHSFPKLPKEIQVAVWNLVVEQSKDERPFIVSVDANRTLLSSKFYSPLLEVCVTSRQVYLRHFPHALHVMHSDVMHSDLVYSDVMHTKRKGEMIEVCLFSPCALGGLVHISLDTDLLIDLSAWWRFQDWQSPERKLLYNELVKAIRPHQFGFTPDSRRLRALFAEHRIARSVGYQKEYQVAYLLFDMLHMPATEFQNLHPQKPKRSSIFSVQLATRRK